MEEDIIQDRDMSIILNAVGVMAEDKSKRNMKSIALIATENTGVGRENHVKNAMVQAK